MFPTRKSIVACLLAQVWDERTQNLVTTGIWLAGALLVGALLVAWISSWRRKSSGSGSSPSDQLAEFRRLHEQGIINDAEFARLRNLLGEKMREQLDVPAPPSVIPLEPEAEQPPRPPETSIRPADEERPPPPPPDAIRPG